MIDYPRTATYVVSDLNAAKWWYAQVLEREPYIDAQEFVGFALGYFELVLVARPSHRTAALQPLWSVSHIEFEYPRLLGLGATELEPIVEVRRGMKVAAVRDPFGDRLIHYGRRVIPLHEAQRWFAVE